jgi:hypothetical protein
MKIELKKPILASVLRVGKTPALFVALLLLVVLTWASNEPWRGKPYQQWDDKDLERIFTDSPWSRTAMITRTWLPLSAKDLPEGPIQGGARKIPKKLEQSDQATLGADVNFNVYWDSSRVMRQASARQAVLHGGKSASEVEKFLNQPTDEFEIVIQGVDMAPFVRKDEKFFQANSYLQPRKSKQKISPSHVHYERDEAGQLVTAAVFFFPKKTGSGEPTIASDEKSIEFTCKLEGATLRVNFEPQKMVDQAGPDL